VDGVAEPFPNYGIVIIVLGLLLIIVTISAGFVYRYLWLRLTDWLRISGV